MSAELITALMPAPTAKTQAQENSVGKNYEWILHPVVDLLFSCGGLLWILFALHFFVLMPQGLIQLLQIMAIVSVVGTHIFSETHTVATLVRAYRTSESRERYSLYTHGAALVGGFVMLAALFVPGLTPILAKLYLLFVVQHFTAQTFGMVLLYCYKRGYWLSGLEKGVLSALMNCTAVMAILRQLTYKEWAANGFLAQKIPFWGNLPEYFFHASTVVLAALAVTFSFLVVRKFVVEKKLMPFPAILLAVTGIAIFCFPFKMASVLFLYAPAFFHGSQYIVLSSAVYLKEKGLPEACSPSKIYEALKQESGLRYLGFLLMGAMVIYLGIPRLLQEFGFDFSLAFATIFSVVNLHHFITDQAIWKLRDPKLRNLVLA